MRNNKKTTVSLFIIIAFLGTIAGLNYSNILKNRDKDTVIADNTTVTTNADQTKSNEANENKKDRVETITISSIGDILMHGSLNRAAYDSKSKNYDYRYMFKEVKGYLEKPDLTIANLETTLGGKDKAYTGYPTFNSPDEIIDALKDSGVDMLTGANNHRMDTGEAGFQRTVDVVKKKGLDIIGVKSNINDKSYVIKDIKGIKVAVVNYTYETGKVNGPHSLNGITMPKKMDGLVDILDFSNLDSVYKTLEKRVKEVKDQGVDAMVFLMHWGIEYQSEPTKEQKLVAKKLSDLGVDVILGGHPHVLEPMDFIHSDISGKDTFVIYSQGNFVSDQRLETVNRRNTEDGIIVNVTITKNFTTNKVEVLDVDYIPTWVNKKQLADKPYYQVLATEDILGGQALPNVTKDDKSRIAKSSSATKSLMNEYTTKCSVYTTK